MQNLANQKTRVRVNFLVHLVMHKRWANRTTINTFDVSLMVQFRVHLIIHLESHLKVHFKIYIKTHKKVHLRMH